MVPGIKLGVNSTDHMDQYDNQVTEIPITTSWADG